MLATFIISAIFWLNQDVEASPTAQENTISEEQQKAYEERRRLRREYFARQQRIRHINSTRPKRLDEPLREENLSDEEARDVESVMQVYYPGVVVVIGPVIDGCLCEDGPACDSQVWVTAQQSATNPALLLSRIDDNWTVGPVQTWWQNYDQLLARYNDPPGDTASDRTSFRNEMSQRLELMLEQFPACEIETTAAAD
ncbi:MAG: hypothetical protein AAF351_01190 [Pseudomonadota bacterium]